MSRPAPPTYKTKTWPAYNEALKRRGSLAIRCDPGMIREAAPTGRRGRQQTCSDAATQTCLTMKVVFGMALRQTTGFVESLPRLVGLDWSVPDFNTLSRRQKTLAVNIPYQGSKGPLPSAKLSSHQAKCVEAGLHPASPPRVQGYITVSTATELHLPEATDPDRALSPRETRQAGKIFKLQHPGRVVSRSWWKFEDGVISG